MKCFLETVLNISLYFAPIFVVSILIYLALFKLKFSTRIITTISFLLIASSLYYFLILSKIDSPPEGSRIITREEIESW